jgi:hypothetical protein
MSLEALSSCRRRMITCAFSGRAALVAVQANSLARHLGRIAHRPQCLDEEALFGKNGLHFLVLAHRPESGFLIILVVVLVVVL